MNEFLYRIVLFQSAFAFALTNPHFEFHQQTDFSHVFDSIKDVQTRAHNECSRSVCESDRAGRGYRIHNISFNAELQWPSWREWCALEACDVTGPVHLH